MGLVNISKEHVFWFMGLWGICRKEEYRKNTALRVASKLAVSKAKGGFF